MNLTYVKYVSKKFGMEITMAEVHGDEEDRRITMYNRLQEILESFVAKEANETFPLSKDWHDLPVAHHSV